MLLGVGWCCRCLGHAFGRGPQGALGVVVANVDMLVGAAALDPARRALVMAALCSVMAELGAARAEGAALAGVGRRATHGD